LQEFGFRVEGFHSTIHPALEGVFQPVAAERSKSVSTVGHF